MKKSVNQIIRDIKSIKIQGARNIAKAALKAYHSNPTKQTKQKLINARPTEPMLQNVLNKLNTNSKEDKDNYEQILAHFDNTQDKINKFTLKTIKQNDVIFTHCHSTNVINALIYAKNKKKKFEVYNTETRPLYQGRKTAKKLKKNKIKVTMFVDSAIGVALDTEQNTKDVDKIFLGADAITKKGIINKIGSGTIAELAKSRKIPVYIIADSWKFTKKYIPIEQRELDEVWDQAPKKIKIKNPAFEFVNKKYIKGIISELGNLSYDNFLRKVG